MRLTTSNPRLYFARTDAEHDLCERVQAHSGQVVLDIWTPESYPFEEITGEQVKLEADCAIRTGRLTNSLFTSGSSYLAFVRDGKVELELEGHWTS
jgi:hypothetical protein